MSSRYVGPELTPAEHAPGYIVGNVDITYVLANAAWKVTGFVHNVSNVAVYEGGAVHPYAPALTYQSIDPPRTFGFRAEYRF